MTRHADQARRLLALAMVMEGASRTDAATACGMDQQTLRDWAHRRPRSQGTSLPIHLTHLESL